MLISAFGFALMAACVKEVSGLGIPVLEIVAARAIVSGMISYADIKRKKISLWGNNKTLLIARGTVGTFALMFVYYAVTTLPLAEATVLQYLHPVFTAMLALFFLKEIIQRSTIACIVMSLIGLVIMIQPNLQIDSGFQYPWLSIGAGVLGAFGSAVAYIIIKKLTKTDDSSVIIFYFPLIALPISIVMLGDDFVVPSLAATGLLILIGIFTQVGQVGLTKALHCADANKATAYAYVQVLFSVFIGWAYFSEVPVATTIMGGTFIMFGALINVLWKR
ncbi:membrane protein [Colwellia marinimaniae]|uniref:Membrane protein n=2 Tax=Colwelliaceae TaxID=267889 RepID=A0ABQ0MQS0_9GAMM|nr:membrane protein [Colwellia marinimaniae]